MRLHSNLTGTNISSMNQRFNTNNRGSDFNDYKKDQNKLDD